MADELQMDGFYEQMKSGIKDHIPLYGDSWKTMSRGKLFDRLKYKFHEFELTLNPAKLISLANMSMLLYIRLKEDPAKGPMDMI